MSEAFNEFFEGKIDFEGQRLVENLIFWTLITATTASFIAGFALQSLQITFGLLSVAVTVVSIAVIPPWPMYRSNPVKWLPVTSEAPEAKK